MDKLDDAHSWTTLDVHSMTQSSLTQFSSDALLDAESNLYLGKMKALLRKPDASDSSNKVNQRRELIREEFKKRMKAAPKTLVQKAEAKKDAIERQLEDSSHKLQELLDFGQELVTNMKVANEKRELLRKEHEKKSERLLKADLEKESIESIAKFENITAKWTELDAFKEPMALFEHMEKQKENVEALMASKDGIIRQCQQEIERINAKCYADQLAMANDIRCLIERIDKQIEVIKMAYNGHLELLEQTIGEERQTINLTAANKWNKFYEDMAECEKTKFDLAKEKEQFYAQEVERVTECQEEITRQTRIRLEKEAEQLEWELRKVRNTVLINSEKLDYNYQVLQKRNEENIIINNQQKRRVAKLTEGISALKSTIANTNAQHDTKLRKYSFEIQKLHESISDLEAKALQFRSNNHRKFNLVWAINFKEITDLITKIYEIDRILYEQQLAMPWAMPDIDLTDINAQPQTRSSTAKATKLSRRNRPSFKEVEMEKSLLRNILRKIADRAGFLIEEKLLKILKPFQEQDQTLVRIDNIFVALRIDNMKSVASLTKFFLPYAYCPNCSNGVPKEVLHTYYKLGREFNEEISSSSSSDASSETGAQQIKPDDCKNHRLVIEPVFVLSALNEFTKHQSNKQIVNTPFTDTKEKTTTAIPFDNETIKSFWCKFKGYVPAERRKVWHSLEHGLNHYVEVLKQRTQLDDECTFLRRQNMELKHLLQKFKV